MVHTLVERLAFFLGGGGGGTVFASPAPVARFTFWEVHVVPTILQWCVHLLRVIVIPVYLLCICSPSIIRKVHPFSSHGIQKPGLWASTVRLASGQARQLKPHAFTR